MTEFHLLMPNNKLNDNNNNNNQYLSKVVRGLKYVKNSSLKVIKCKQTFNVIPLTFYITKLILNPNRFSTLILNNNNEPQQFINSYLGCHGYTYRTLSNQNLFVAGFNGNVVMLEPGMIFRTHTNKVYFCTSIDVCSKKIHFFKVLHYFEIEIKEMNDIKEAIDLKFNIKEKALNEKKKHYFIIQKNYLQYFYGNKINIEIDSNLLVNDQNEFHGLLMQNASESYKVMKIDLESIIEHYRFKSSDRGYPKKFLDGLKLLILYLFWTDAWASFKYSKKPTASMY